VRLWGELWPLGGWAGGRACGARRVGGGEARVAVGLLWCGGELEGRGLRPAGIVRGWGLEGSGGAWIGGQEGVRRVCWRGGMGEQWARGGGHGV